MGSETDPRYLAAWRRMDRLRTAIQVSAWIGLGWIVSVVLMVASGVLARNAWWPLAVLAFLIVADLGVAVRLRHAPCPRCNDAFSRFRWALSKRRRGPWKCENCGLPHGAKRDPNAGEG